MLITQIPPQTQPPPVLQAKQLTKNYLVRAGFFKHQTIRALNQVSFSIARGKTLAVVGESGCGKSTLARLLTMIEKPTAGALMINGCNVADVNRATRKALRPQVQMVFQNPFASLNPRKTIKSTLAEPLMINTTLKAAARDETIIKALDMVGLPAEFANRYPHMFSGGQRQRIAIARAMILNPQILVADEPVSALDVSIQAQILNLFMDLQAHFHTSYVFISHNLSVVEHLADDLMVMYFGGVAEIGDKARIFERPRHPYTCTLMSAMPLIHRTNQPNQPLHPPHLPVRGEPPSPLNPPSGCTFHPRCPYAIDRCRREEPQLREVEGRRVACHRAEEIDSMDSIKSIN